MFRYGKTQQCLLQPNKTSKLLLFHHKSSILSSLPCCSLYQVTCRLTQTNLTKIIKNRICQNTKLSPSFLMMHPISKIRYKLRKRKNLSKASSLLNCSRNMKLLSKPKMESLTMRPLEVKSLGLELPMQRKSSSDTKMIKGKFRENGWTGQNLLRKNQNFLKTKSLS